MSETKKKPEFKYTKRQKVKKATIYLFVDKLFTLLGVVLNIVFFGVLVQKTIEHDVSYWCIPLIWIFLSYLVLPRLHQLFTTIYIPDYFMLRTKTGDGLFGDPINMGFVGSIEDVHAAMRRCGFVMADPITFRTSIGIARSSITKKRYPAAPVSNLYLFDQKQDFAYQQDVAGSNVQRHHIRFYKMDDDWTLASGTHVDYLAAASFDCGIGLTNATLQFTHRVDANVDNERDYISESLMYYDPLIHTDMQRVLEMPIRDVNGGGDVIETDGKLSVVDVQGAYNRAIDQGFDTTQIDSLDFLQDSKTFNQELPPRTFMFVGVGIVIKIIMVIVMIVILQINMSGTEKELMAFVLLCTELGMQVVEFILYRLTYKKYKWARVVLLGMLIISAASELNLFNLEKTSTIIDVVDTCISMALVLIASSYDIRQFVYEVKKRGA